MKMYEGKCNLQKRIKFTKQIELYKITLIKKGIKLLTKKSIRLLKSSKITFMRQIKFYDLTFREGDEKCDTNAVGPISVA